MNMFPFTNIKNQSISEEEYSKNYIGYFFDFLEESKIVIGGEGRKNLNKVFERIEENFKLKYRNNGEPYISHLIEVTKIFIESVGISNISFNDIIIALLHDSIEDIKHENFESIRQDFGEYVALGVLSLSKPELEKNTNKTLKQLKKERNALYYPRFRSLASIENFIEEKSKQENIQISPEQISKIARSVASIKLSDRIHNLRTMPLKKTANDRVGFSIQKKEEKLGESRYFREILIELRNYNLLKEFTRAELFGNHSIFGEKLRAIIL